MTATRFIGVDLAWREGSADVAANETGVAVIDENGQNLDAGCFVSETYLYATLADVAELGYDTERPRYKRKPPNLRAAQWRAKRAANCDTLIGRLGQLADADPPLLLQSHPVTRDLAGQLSPVSDPAYKQREDLIDALLCAWTASLWARHGFDRCQVLGLPATPNGDPAATMIVPARQNSDENRYLNPHYPRPDE